MRIAGVGLLTGWGRGVEALPEDAAAAAAGRYVVAMPAPDRSSDRHRRATRDCLSAIAAVDDLLARVGRARADLAGSGTALLYATASTYGASNRTFIESSGTVYFPYTAPSAVPAEVAIEYGLCGDYLNFIGGATATLEALWYAGNLLDRGECNRALVLAVETFEECGDLYRRARWLAAGPLVEAAACALLLPGGSSWRLDLEPAAPTDVRRRAGETLACEPLIALALEGAAVDALAGRWRGRRATLRRI